MISNKPVCWVPTLYFAEALPYMAVMTLSVIMYTNLGLTNTELALYTSWLYLPWVIKPLWSPLIDAAKTKRWWILAMQILIGASLGGVALTLQTAMWLKLSLALFWLMAFSSATHDIAADGFYILGLNEKEQALYVGWRSTFYRIGSIFCQGFIVLEVGALQLGYLLIPYRFYPDIEYFTIHVPKLNIQESWIWSFALLSLIFLFLAFYHSLKLPSVERVEAYKYRIGDAMEAFVNTLKTFFSKPGIVPAMLFMLLFRFPEAQLAKMAQPFMLRSLNEGGLGLETATVGLAYGTLGVFGLLAGGIIGGWLVSRHGLKRWWWPMIMAISLPDAVYIYLSICQPDNIWIIISCVFVEQFGYGFGFSAYMLFLVYFAKGEKSTSVFSICTAFQALGMMIPGMFAGWIADQFGFVNFFWWVMACCLVTFAVSAMVKIRD